MGLFVSFAPWILFWVITSDNSFEEAAVAALIASLILAGMGVAHGKTPKLLDYGTIVWFGFLVIVALTADEDFFADWSYILSNFALAAIVLLSIVVGQPFTRQYARETVPQEYWDTPMFMQSTAVIAWFWLGALILMGVSSIFAREYPADEVWWNWIVPLALFIGAIKFTAWYPDHLRGGPRDATGTSSG
jgi:intracellular septation protein A